MRKIAMSDAFKRRLNSFIKQHRELDSQLEKTLAALESDIHQPSLKTHKLHGKMFAYHACSINYHHRLVFRFDEQYIYPQSIGDHDDVY